MGWYAGMPHKGEILERRDSGDSISRLILSGKIGRGKYWFMNFVYITFEFYVKNILEIQRVKKNNTSSFQRDFKHCYGTLPIIDTLRHLLTCGDSDDY